ncbi:hypothetical protein FVE85_3123 [Porphyridium purpureum]|uniref:Uncharacterized protein n=1 Tax=Porphyridium purpureum TaxID=35688 RepID=A0A5J4YVK0_PORPP|nr:hypothetical protein FVE85_3123 [Porphyridium purpureum]|eukprot:POR0923..scf227_4
MAFVSVSGWPVISGASVRARGYGGGEKLDKAGRTRTVARSSKCRKVGVRMVGNDGGGGEGSKKDKERRDENSKPDDERLVQALELSYVGVWVALGTKGVGEDYLNALKAFILATIAAYERGYTLSAVLLELQINSSFTQNARKLGLSDDQIANASLSDSDKKTREYWLQLVYLTLSYLRHTPPTPPLPPPADPQKLDQLVRFVVDQYKRGFTLDGMKLEQSLNASSTSTSTGSPDTASPDPRAAQMSRAQASIRSQWMRIVQNEIPQAKRATALSILLVQTVLANACHANFENKRFKVVLPEVLSMIPSFRDWTRGPFLLHALDVAELWWQYKSHPRAPLASHECELQTLNCLICADAKQKVGTIRAIVLINKVPISPANHVLARHQ